MEKEHKKKISESMMGNQNGLGNKANLGKTFTEEHLQKLRGKIPWNKGEKMSEEYKEQRKENNWMRGKKPWNTGKKGIEYISPEGLNKMRTSATIHLKGRTYEEIYGPEKAKEQKEKRRIKTQQQYDNGTATFGFSKDGSMKVKRRLQIFPKKDTYIEVKIQNFLKDLNLDFYTHHYILEITHGYQCDISIPIQKRITQKIILECDGDWWHGNEEIYPNLTEAQRCQRELDYIRTKELKEAGFKVIRLWEHEIKNLDLTIFKNKIGLPI
jgi:G:T-mismatch repair DNA endonuclease (very short patch repair protein)